MSTQSEKTRTKILQATLDLLLAPDGTNTRMSDVAKRAGVSRQAVYLHFDNRADLLIAATKLLDDQLDADGRLAASRAAQSGLQRLDAFVQAWGNYIPEIYGAARAIIAMARADDAAAAAWGERMRDMREGCAAAIDALNADKTLARDYTPQEATDQLWMMLSVANWEHATQTCNWSQEKYIKLLTISARRLFYHSPGISTESP